MKELVHLKLSLKIRIVVLKRFAVEDFVMGEHDIHPHFWGYSFRRVKGPNNQFKFIPTLPSTGPAVPPPSHMFSFAFCWKCCNN